MGINYANLVGHFRTDPAAAARELKEAFRAKELRAADFGELGGLWEACYGYDTFKDVRAGRALANDVMNTALKEASGAVATAAFTNITGQIMYSTILDAYDAAANVFRPLIPVVKTQFLDGEKIAGISNLGDETQHVKEGDPYPLATPAEDWIQTPSLKKRGVIVPVTREAIFADRTGVLLDRCSKVGESAGYADELRAIDTVIDENTGAASALVGGHRYHWRGDSIATYGDDSGTHTWDNKAATNALVDWSDIEAAELLLDAMEDPGTGLVTGAYRAAATHLVVYSGLVHTAKQILSATEIRVHAGGYATSGNLSERVSPSSVQTYTLVTSPLLSGRLTTDTHWFLGNIGKAFRKMEAWPIETSQAPANSHDEFHRDIVVQYKVSQCDAYTTFDPRYMIQSTVA